MSIVKKVKQVERLFNKLQTEVAQFQNTTQLSCKATCGACCNTPKVSASPLEFLPLAYYLYQNKLGDTFLSVLESHTDATCLLYNATEHDTNKGFCGHYVHRGLICRLFGYAAVYNKYNQKELSTCNTIKTEQLDKYLAANAAIKQKLKVPTYKLYYGKLAEIDPDLGSRILPINQALSEAVEYVERYFFYNAPKKPRRKKAA